MADGMIWYFAYGSNMDVTRLVDARLKPKRVAIGARIGGRLADWRLTFDKPVGARAGAGAGNIVPASGDVVHGTLNAMPQAGLVVLDRYEGVADGHYERRTVPVVRADTGAVVEAVTYVALRTREGLRPTREYLGHLLAGRDLLPPDYVQRLMATPTLD
jgi:cation transport regulator ChaC